MITLFLQALSSSDSRLESAVQPHRTRQAVCVRSAYSESRCDRREKAEQEVERRFDRQECIGVMVNFCGRIRKKQFDDRMAQQKNTDAHKNVERFGLDQRSAYALFILRAAPLAQADAKTAGEAVDETEHKVNDNAGGADRGFSNASRFAAAFRRQFGCNPGEYNSRKRLFCHEKICYICLIACSISRSEAVTLILETIVSAVRFFHRDFENRSLLDLRGCEIAHEFYELRVVLGETVS